MDFLEDLEIYEQAMGNAYDIITRKKTVDDIYFDLEDEEYDEFYLPFDPVHEDGPVRLCVFIYVRISRGYDHKNE